MEGKISSVERFTRDPSCIFAIPLQICQEICQVLPIFTVSGNFFVISLFFVPPDFCWKKLTFASLGLYLPETKFIIFGFFREQNPYF